MRHAAGARIHSESVVAAVELADGTVGYGETLPRTYVTGESVERVLSSAERVFAPLLVSWRPANFPEALELAADLPARDEHGTLVTAARAAVELAVLDAYSRYFDRLITDVAGWFGRSGLGPPGSIERVRCSGALTADTAERVLSRLWKMRLFGLRDFKLKVGFEGDEAVFRAVGRRLRRALRSGRSTLRLDANGAWSVEQAREKLSRWADVPIRVVEQPLAKGLDHELPDLRSAVGVPFMLDESLVTIDDAERLVIDRVMDWMNVRISKVGGFLPALKLADFARQHGVSVLLGCMVGESSILSAAARRLLECLPNIELVEGNYGAFLLTEDLVRKPLRFGYAGRLRSLPGPGWGIEVQADRLATLSVDKPRRLRL